MGIPDDASPHAAARTSVQRRIPLEQHVERHTDIKDRVIPYELLVAPSPIANCNFCDSALLKSKFYSSGQLAKKFFCAVRSGQN
jgi:hypothetical protein